MNRCRTLVLWGEKVLEVGYITRLNCTLENIKLVSKVPSLLILKEWWAVSCRVVGQDMTFSIRVQMWELDIKKAECQRSDAFQLWCLRRLLRVPWAARRWNQSILKEINPGRTDAEAEAPILWPPDAKNWFIGKDPDAGKDWRQEEKGTTKEEMAGWHHWLSEHEFKQAPGDGDGQESLACCSPWGHKELDMTEWLNNNICMGRGKSLGSLRSFLSYVP